MEFDLNKAIELATSLIKKSEGCYLTAYLCPAGKWTIGYGHTNNVKKGDKITLGKAYEFLNEDIKETCQLFNHYLRQTKLNIYQYAAFIDFTFNVGIGRVINSLVFKAMMANPNDTKIKDLFLNWVYGGDGSHNGIDDDCDGIVDEPGEKKRLPGIVTRRFNEANLYFTK